MTGDQNAIRRWPCVDCRDPRTAMRPDTRCPKCSYLARLERMRKYLANRKANGTTTGKPKAAKQKTQPQSDRDITLYRAEKALRKEYGPATRDVQICFEVAAQLKAEKPKAGRPKKRGFMPQTFGKYAA